MTVNNISVNENLSVGGWYPSKPYCAMIFTTSDTGTGAFTVSSLGYRTLTAANVRRAGPGNMNYVFDFPVNHPNGAIFGYCHTDNCWFQLFHNNILL